MPYLSNSTEPRLFFPVVDACLSKYSCLDFVVPPAQQVERPATEVLYDKCCWRMADDLCTDAASGAS
jgi:hypothetical protein